MLSAPLTFYQPLSMDRRRASKVANISIKERVSLLERRHQ